MGTISIMHWLIVLFPVLIIAIVTKATRGSSAILGRGGYALRVIGVYVVNWILQEIASYIARYYYNFGFLLAIEVLALVVSMVFVAYWTVSRLRDAGKSVNCAYFMAIPIIGGFYPLILMFDRSVQRTSDEATQSAA